MFERRLKILLGFLLLITIVMVLRAAQLQVVGAQHWRQQATDSMKTSRLIETTRGTILDAKNRPIALDAPCRDAAVDYRALTDPPNPAWLNVQAAARLRRELGDAYGKLSAEQRKLRLEAAAEAVMHDIDEMWRVLAEVSDQPIEAIDETRRAIVERVQMRRRYVWYHKYRKAVEQSTGKAAPWYAQWLIDNQGDGPQLDNFVEDVGEQEAAHPILHNVSNDVFIRLKKARDKYPGLTFLDSADRSYPYGGVAAHALGRLSKVASEDIAADPNLGKSELREYQKNDLIGRTGLEALCEPALRGTRGQVVRVAGESTELSRVESVPGANVRATLDIELQQDVEDLFKRVEIKHHPRPGQTAGDRELVEMHGAAVVIDVPTGAVRVLASWPTFDANRFDVDYAKLAGDEVNKPLLNRATQWAIEPGSTVKPIVGLGAIADGLCKPMEGIECTGYMIHRGRKKLGEHRCWVASMFAASHGEEGVKHHRIPSYAPHKGHDGNPDGSLTFSDALERSCNVYFETLAGRMGIGGVSKWMDRFGLGRRTGIGIAESRGWLPDGQSLSHTTLLGDTWNAGIGQGQVGATALQMANVAATIARDGVWVRPHLVDSSIPTTRPASMMPDGPDRVDLGLPPEAIAQAKRGMVNVVYAPGGTATYEQLIRHDVKVAGKTGSATAAPFRTPMRDEKTGAIAYETVEVKDARGEVVRTYRRVKEWIAYTPRSPQNPDGYPSWYRGFGPEGRTISHAWFIGYAPADNPQIAFAAMVEYGGSGGHAAGSVANGVIDACIKHGYLAAAKVADAR